MIKQMSKNENTQNQFSANGKNTISTIVICGLLSTGKVEIGEQKVDIAPQKADIESVLSKKEIF